MSLEKESLDNINDATKTNSSLLVEAYALLHCSAEMTDEELKSSFRKQVKAYHSDVLRAKVIPEDLIEIANAKMAKLNESWELICKARGI